MNYIYNTLTMSNDADLILPIKENVHGSLWLGNYKSALDLEFLVKNNISVIINCSPDIPFIYEVMDPEQLCQKNKNFCGLRQLETFRIPVFDSLLEHDINLMEHYLPTVLHFIIKHLFKQHNILVHCHQGAQRSSAIIAAVLYVLNDNKIHMIDIIHYIRKHRPRVFAYGFRINFQKSLENYFNITI